MKTLFRLIFILSTLFVMGHSATRGDVKIIEASEDIRYLSQKIVKEYLLYYQYPEKIEIKENLTFLLGKLSTYFRVIAVASKDSDTKDLLEFLAYSRDQMEEIFTLPANNENVALMLDYSETLIEGADSISESYRYNFTEEENMLIVTKKMQYLLERITKYYMALNAGFNNTTNKEQLDRAFLQFEKNLETINLYTYPYQLEKQREKINKVWGKNKPFLNQSKKLFIPLLLFVSIDYLETIFDKLALYHSKNQ